MKQLFRGIFDTDMTVVIDVLDFFLVLLTALVLGLIIALSYMYRTRYTKSFVVTLALLPAVVAMVIMMVNGNIGAGVAVAGAFSLVRFRSVPGTAREIGTLFLAMGAGLCAGMGYLAYALLFTLLLSLIFLLFNRLRFLGGRANQYYRTLSITVPEDLNYTDAFTDILEGYTAERELIRVKTTNMGSMFRLTYTVTMKRGADERAMLNALRTRNANLEISLSRQETAEGQL